MKHMFVRYCQASKAWNEATPEELKKAYEKVKKSAKEHGLELIFLGPAWGVIESPAWVFTSEKSIDNYYKWLMSTADLGLPQYFTASRTVTLTEAPFLM
jgi:hypothetical protein